MENLRELLIEELKDLYSAEKQIVKALPKMIRGAASDELKTAITEHLEVTKGQVSPSGRGLWSSGRKTQGKALQGHGRPAEGRRGVSSGGRERDATGSAADWRRAARRALGGRCLRHSQGHGRKTGLGGSG